MISVSFEVAFSCIKLKLDLGLAANDDGTANKTPAKKLMLKNRIQQKPMSKALPIAKAKATYKAKKSAKADGNISPALARWMATQKDEPKDETEKHDASAPKD
jgi:hypothetical protein